MTECPERSTLERHLLDVRALSSAFRPAHAIEDSALRAVQFATTLLKEHDSAGHDGKPCPGKGC
jgi:hypothetical protein